MDLVDYLRAFATSAIIGFVILMLVCAFVGHVFTTKAGQALRNL